MAAYSEIHDDDDDGLILTVTLDMTYVNFISLIESSVRGILYPVMLCQLSRKTEMHSVTQSRTPPHV